MLHVVPQGGGPPRKLHPRGARTQDVMILSQIASMGIPDLASLLSAAKSTPSSSMAGGTDASLSAQWSNPSDVSTILMVIGGDVVQKALAQGTGVWYFTPVCFSFGCVSYAFTALVNIIGDGRLLPEPDYPVKVFNLDSGYVRDNKNWVVGRLLRDIETGLSEEEPLADDAIRISVFEAAVNHNGLTHFSLSRMHLGGLACILLQLGLAAVPIALAREWDVMLITAAGTLLVQMAGCLPQWRAEKLPNRQARSATYALTQGNGSREVVVVFGNGNCLDLEELSASGSPRGGRPWEKFTWRDVLSRARAGDGGGGVGGFPPAAPLPRRDTQLRRARVRYGLPLGFWLTRASVVAQSVLWLLLLVNVASARSYNWVLLAVGALGMFQNGYLAGVARPPHLRNLPLTRVEVIRAKKVMDGLMDLEEQYGCAEPLRDEFFPGRLREAEYEWWRGNREPYDLERLAAKWRGTPRRYQRRISTRFGAAPRYAEAGRGQAPPRVEGSEGRYSHPFPTPSVAGGAAGAGLTPGPRALEKMGHALPISEVSRPSPAPGRVATPASAPGGRLSVQVVSAESHRGDTREPGSAPALDEKRRWKDDHGKDVEMDWRDSITRLPSDDM